MQMLPPAELSHDEAARVTHQKLQAQPQALLGLALVLVLRGEVELREREVGRILLLPSDVALVAPGTQVELRSRSEVAELVEFRAPPAWLDATLHGLCCSWPSSAAREPVGVSRAGSEVARRAGRALRELSGPAPGVGPAARLRDASGHLELVACALESRQARLPWTAPRRASSRRRAAFLDTVSALAEGSLEDLSLEQCAARLRLSPRQTSRLFRQELGISFREWIASRRIDLACQLLRETDLPVIDVAAESGWGSLNHFNATFRQRKGCTPSAFREATRRGAG